MENILLTEQGKCMFSVITTRGKHQHGFAQAWNIPEHPVTGHSCHSLQREQKTNKTMHQYTQQHPILCLWQISTVMSHSLLCSSDYRLCYEVIMLRHCIYVHYCQVYEKWCNIYRRNNGLFQDTSVWQTLVCPVVWSEGEEPSPFVELSSTWVRARPSIHCGLD